MASYSFQGNLDHSTDAAFRLWGTAIRDMLAAIGLVKTTDTGQIDWTTVVRPAVGAFAGYEIYRFDDALQATRPIFIKIEYGTGNTATYPALRISVGPATNGAGTMAITYFANQVITRSAALAAGNNSWSYGCKLNAMGGFMLSLWNGSVSVQPSGYFMFGLFRPTDDNGAPLDEAICMLYDSGASPMIACWSFISNSLLYNTASAMAFVPGSISVTSVGADVQVFRHVCATPRVRHLPMTVSHLVADFTKNTSFPAIPVGGVSRSHVAQADAFTGTVIAGSATLFGLAMVFE